MKDMKYNDGICSSAAEAQLMHVHLMSTVKKELQGKALLMETLD